MAPPAAPDDGRGATLTNVLVNNAKYWRTRGEPKYALRELDRVLGYQRNNTEALAMAAEISLEISDYDAASRYRQMLSQVAPNDPRIASLAAERQRSPEEVQILANARQLARDGKMVDAVERYQRVFAGGQVPRSLAVEYYDALGHTPAGFDEASQSMGALADQSPDDAALQLAYARLLTVDEGSRAAGIRKLSELAKDPAVASSAQQAWRETLLWQGASEKARTQVQAYLSSYPGDTVMAAKLKEFDGLLPDDGAKAMIRGYNLMASDPAAAEKEFKAALAFNPNDLDAMMMSGYMLIKTDPAAAEKEFKAALALKPNNPEPMIMLAGLYRRQKRLVEAQLLIDHAVALAPERKAQLVRDAGGDYPLAEVAPVETEFEIARLTASGQYEKAEQLRLELMAGHETAASLVKLGNLQRLMGKLEQAEATLQKARAQSPGNGDAVRELAAVNAAAGHADAAATLYTEAAALYEKSHDKTGLRLVQLGRADLAKASQQAAGPVPGAAADGSGRMAIRPNATRPASFTPVTFGSAPPAATTR